MAYTPNLWIPGDVCTAEKMNSGETEIAANEAAISALAVKLPEVPQESGVYELTANVSNGNPTYYWEKQPMRAVLWSTGTDEEIVAAMQAAHAGTIDLQQDFGWAVGDLRIIHIEAFTAGGDVAVAACDVGLAISSFDEYENCGNVMQVDFMNCPAQGIRMNPTNTTSGGYGASEMYTTSLPAMVNALPSYLKNMLITFNVVQGDNIVTGNKLALRSWTETSGNGSDGSFLQFYSEQSNLQKSIWQSSGVSWWLRSPNYSLNFYYIGSGGGWNTERASVALACAPFGCL